MHEKENPHKPPTKVKKTREEMWITLENKKEVATHFLRSVLKRKNKVEEGGAFSSRMKSKQ